jgi:hypothetical protein
MGQFTILLFSHGPTGIIKLASRNSPTPGFFSVTGLPPATSRWSSVSS